MIEVEHLTRRFGQYTAVNDISFRLEKGDVVGFLGPNGAGKTTTMRMLTGFLPATSGSIRIGGHDALTESLAVRKRIGYLPESVPLYREHRVEEMLRFQGRLHGLGRADRERRTGEVLERVGLLDRRRATIGTLSKGQRQRIGLAVALLPDPEVLILDEPTSGLDPLQRLEVRGLVHELSSERTVLLSSHILPEIEAVCPRVIILHRGSIVADGLRTELAQSVGGASVRMEAVVGDAAEATRLLASLPGVDGVVDHGREGIHQRFEIRGQADLREDVGALAAQRGWALRELSWDAPSLERLFARIALELDETSPEPRASAVPVPDPVNEPEPEGKVAPLLYNLNPFDQGAARELGQPKQVEPTQELTSLDPPGASGASDDEDCRR